MAIINAYPSITPKGSDLVLISDTSIEGNPTKTATIDSINAISTAPTIITERFELNDSQIRNLGTNPVVLVPGESNKAVQIISAALTPQGSGGIGSNYVFTGNGVISWDPDGSGNQSAEIPTLVMDQIGGGLNAGVESAAISKGNIRFGAGLSFGTADGLDPTLFGTPIGSCVIYLTYKILEL
tara:strand:+ start:291 stop:839 length:549 start_codon:yes stop_codon:yes gene_type:complete